MLFNFPFSYLQESAAAERRSCAHIGHKVHILPAASAPSSRCRCGFGLVILGFLVLGNWGIMLNVQILPEAARKLRREVQVTSGLFRIFPPSPSNTHSDSLRVPAVRAAPELPVKFLHWLHSRRARGAEKRWKLEAPSKTPAAQPIATRKM